MGRRNKEYSKTLHQQAYDRLTGMQAFGESKKEAVANGTDKEKIFSFNTYATDIYRKYARPIEEIPYDKVNKGTGKRYQSEVYSCRKDEAGKKLDKAAMLVCSKALGHNRISVVADNYIRGL